MTIEFCPETLKQLLGSELAGKRLKNRSAVATCAHCGYSNQGFVIPLYHEVKEFR